MTTNRDKIRQVIASKIHTLFAERTSGKLSEYEANALNFLADMQEHVGQISDKQRAWFIKLAIDFLPFRLKWGNTVYEIAPDILEKLL